MKNDLQNIRNTANRSGRKPERPPPLPEPSEQEMPDDTHIHRLHLLERRGHRWERRNAHA
jgi:hypothetical protein